MQFYGYRLNEVLDLSSTDFFYLIAVMKKVKATNRIEALQVSAYPHLKPSEAKKVHKKAYKDSEPDDVSEKNIIKLSDINRALNG